MINTQDFKDFEFDNQAFEGKYAIAYMMSKDMKTAKEYYHTLSQGEDLVDDAKELGINENEIAGVEIGLEIDLETYDVALFTYAIVWKNDGGQEAIDTSDILMYEDDDVINMLEVCCNDTELINNVKLALCEKAA